MVFQLSPSPRVRRSPYYQATVDDGVVSFTTYNHMLMPTGYGDPVAEYHRLVNGVAIWDVAVERQIEINGPDAAQLVQALVPRKLDRLKPGRGWYVPVCDHRGTVINDPVLLMHSLDKYWLSIADSDLLLWVRAIAAERGYNVRVSEPDVSPLAVQGPKAEDVVAALLGEEIRSIRCFHFRQMELDGIPFILARSGWSGQDGFELYLMDGSRGHELWQKVKLAGQPFGIGPGCPNPVERVESGLLSWGGDTDDQTNPFEIGLERYVDMDAPDDVIGIQALREIRASGIRRQRLGLYIDYDGRFSATDIYSTVYDGDRKAGHVTAHAYSPRLKRNIGIGLVSTQCMPGDTVRVKLPNGDTVPAKLIRLPFPAV